MADVGDAESALYAPVKALLEGQGYTVKGEVASCDVVAVRGDEPPVIVELKRTLTLDLVLQCVDRLAMSDAVYLAVPRSCAALKRRRRAVTGLLRRLGLGLIAVDPKRQTAPADVLLDPGPYAPRGTKRRRDRLLREFQRRRGDPNIGGQAMKGGIVTAYRQRAVCLAAYLAEQGPTKASVVASDTGDADARAVLYSNHYGWFERLGNGVYDVTGDGRSQHQHWQTRLG